MALAQSRNLVFVRPGSLVVPARGRKVFVIGIRGVAVRGPEDADEEDQREREENKDRVGSAGHSAPPGSILLLFLYDAR